jgi:hypothetical protein
MVLLLHCKTLSLIMQAQQMPELMQQRLPWDNVQSPSSITSVIINPIPATPVVAASPVCEGTSLTLTAH